MASWIFSSNQKFFRSGDALKDLKIIEWYQEEKIVNVEPGDVVYMYFSTPDQRIAWKCNVIETQRMEGTLDLSEYKQPGETWNMEGPFIVLEADTEYDVGPLLDYDRLKQHGLKSRLMSPEKVKPELQEYIDSINKKNLQKLLEEDAYNSPLDVLKELIQGDVLNKTRRKTVTTQQIVRSARIATYTKRKAKGKCQLCGKNAPFKDCKGNPYLEAHHIKPLSEGGMDSLDNTVALCPNCHRKMYVVNDAEDVMKLKRKNSK